VEWYHQFMHERLADKAQAHQARREIIRLFLPIGAEEAAAVRARQGRSMAVRAAKAEPEAVAVAADRLYPAQAAAPGARVETATS